MRRRGTVSRKPSKTQHRKPTRPKRSNAPTAARRGSSSLADLQEQVAILARELGEAREQQIAASEVLQIISRSAGEPRPVFEALLENATKLCEASYGAMWLREGDAFRGAAFHGDLPAAYTEQFETPFRPSAEEALARVAHTRKPVYIADFRKYRAYLERRPLAVAGVEVAGIRTFFVVPMLKHNELVGAIAIYRREMRPFTNSQILLVQNFAAQAVIAIENARLLSELRESLQQQTATADVLRVISSSPGGLEPVFSAMMENALRICEAKFGMLMRYSDGAFVAQAMVGAPPALVDALLHKPFTPPPGNPLGRMLCTKQLIHSIDAASEESKPLSAQLAGARSHIVVPMLKDNELVGAITIYRQEVRPFTEKQIALVQNFAAQAVIAIENTRLLNELRESLQQQTATTDVLQVISRSTFDLQTVLDTLVESAARLCEGESATIWRPDEDAFKLAAHCGAAAHHVEAMKKLAIRPGRETCAGRALLERQTIHIPDCEADPDWNAPGILRSRGNRAMLGVPLLREGGPIGVLIVTRLTARPFTERQIELAATFADQAVIAIENVRLFDEVQARTRELSEALEQQTATSEVLGVISSSPGELEPVFEAMLANATRLCEAKFGTLYLYEGDGIRAVAAHNVPPAFAQARRRGPIYPPPGSGLCEAIRTKQTVHVTDLAAAQPYVERNPAIVEGVELGGVRTFVAVPMLKDNELIGMIAIYRQEVRPFTNKQIELVTNFAAQAVIAIENTRLLNELRESLQQQTATADVLKVISRSTFDLRSVLNTLVESAAHLCDANTAIICRPKGESYEIVAGHSVSPDFYEYMQSHPIPIGPGTVTGRTALEGRAIHVHDVLTDPDYKLSEAQRLGGYRTTLGVPLLREGVPIGVMAMNRLVVRPFTDKQIELITTFADQAVIAIENVRLFDEVKARTEELSESLQQQTATADVLKVISRSAFDLKSVLQTLVEIGRPTL